MAADLLEEAGWTAASAAHDYTALIGEFGGTPHLVGLAMVGGGDHIVLVPPGALRSTLENADEYISHSVRLARIRDRLVATRTKVPVIFLEVPPAMVGDFEAFDDYDREDFVPFCSRFRKAMPLASDVLGAYRGVPAESDDVDDAPEAAGALAPAPPEGEVVGLLRELTAQASDNFGPSSGGSTHSRARPATPARQLRAWPCPALCLSCQAATSWGRTTSLGRRPRRARRFWERAEASGSPEPPAAPLRGAQGPLAALPRPLPVRAPLPRPPQRIKCRDWPPGSRRWLRCCSA